MSKQWVLIRGMMSEAFHWWDFLPLLQAQFPEDTFHTPDIIGNGKTHHLSTPISVQKNIQGLREQVPSEGKKILLGFSLGAMLALEWAHAHPEEVDSVVLINCSLNNSLFYKRMRPSSLAPIFKSARQKEMEEREAIIMRMTTGLPEERIRELAKHWGPRSAQFPVKSINFIWQIMIAAQIPQRKEPPSPVLVLSSGQDKVVHPDCSDKLATTWNLPLTRHPHAGHDLTLEDPHWVIEKLNTFISR